MLKKIAFFLLFSLLLVQTMGSLGAAAAPDQDVAEVILQRMTPEERVGQLFLVTFQGDSVSEDDPIYELIVNGHIAGVVLQRENNNFTGAPDTIESLMSLNETLQDIEHQSSLVPRTTGPLVDAPERSTYVPLFIASTHEGGKTIYTEILNGIPELPSQMAIGATWQPDLARKTGEIIGEKLQSLGINLLLGPSLDVLEDPRLVGTGDLGVRSFGGDPYWVSEMGKAYIQGVHEGANGRIALIAKHFPGLGSADRPIEEEVATIRKSLEQLKQIELAPFFAVTQAAPGEETFVADGLLTSHIRFQGFQGNIRATTRPISLDPQAYSQLLVLEPIAQWRQAGGITVSDSLGSRAIRRFRDPLEASFKAHLTARDAFWAGNDLLLLSNIRNPVDPDELTTVRTILSFFASKYREDTAFAARVDEAVLRILRLKLRLYGGLFSREVVRPDEIDPSELASGGDATYEVARSAASLITPLQESLEDRVGGPPQLGERIVFFTDVRVLRQCSTCEATPEIPVTAMEEMVLSLYGPAAAGQVGGWNIRSFSMADLAHYLGATPPTSPVFPLTPREQLVEALSAADWLVFTILDSTDDIYGSNALKMLLDQRPDLARGNRVMVFAMDVPYVLDATDLSKVDAYYGLYARGTAFVDVAAHLLFLELSAPGAPPVSVPGIGYDLIEATSPNASQVISLEIRAEDEEVLAEDVPQAFSVGDLIHIGTGIIVDANSHPVPDGTVVEFTFNWQGETAITQTMEATTIDGIAEVTVPLDKLGLLTVIARSDPARISETLQLNVQEDIPAQATVISPTMIPTRTPRPTRTAQSPTPTTAPVDASSDEGDTPQREVSLMDFFSGLSAVGLVAFLGLRAPGIHFSNRTTRMRSSLLSVLGGLLGYNYLALGLPGSQPLLEAMGTAASFLLPLLCSLTGFALAWYGMNRKEVRRP